MSTTELATGGDVEITNVMLTNYQNQSADIINMFAELEIYEDIHSHSLSGSITIVDTSNLIKEFPIIGEETLAIEFKTPGFPDVFTIKQTFMVYKLANILVPTPHKQIYVLYFTTPEALTDLNARVFKAFNGTPCNIIKSILGSDGLNSPKKTQISSCNNNLKFVAPSWNPFKCISYLTSRGQSSDSFKASNFLFYETNKQYYFKSINELFEADPEPKVEYFYDNDPARLAVSDSSTRNVASEMMKIYELTIDTKFNMLERLDHGYYSQFVWDHNILIKKLTKRRYFYPSDFNSTKHAEKFPVTSGNLKIGKDNSLSSVVTYPQSHDGIMEDNYGKVITNKFPLMDQLNTIKMDITVHGRTDLEVGKMVKIKMGGMEMLTPDDKTKPFTDRYDGRYLVMAILHRVTPKKHQMVMSVARDSVTEAY